MVSQRLCIENLVIPKCQDCANLAFWTRLRCAAWYLLYSYACSFFKRATLHFARTWFLVETCHEIHSQSLFTRACLLSSGCLVDYNHGGGICIYSFVFRRPVYVKHKQCTAIDMYALYMHHGVIFSTTNVLTQRAFVYMSTFFTIWFYLFYVFVFFRVALVTWFIKVIVYIEQLPK